MTVRSRLTARFVAFLRSDRFFWLTIILFVAEAGWIALSARYPQAFDEQFHFGIIQIYAHHLSPFLASQPPGADSFGALARDPSYLYQYLLSFPYRLISHFTGDVTIQVIFLRFINLAFLASSLPIFRRVLRYTTASTALINLTLFFFVLTPVFPLLGSQINYDNLVIPLSGLAVLGYLNFARDLRDRHVWRWDRLAWLLVLCLLGSLVKYAFLPISLALGLLTVWTWFRSGRRLPAAGKRLRTQFSGAKLAVYIVVILAAGGLFWQRYGINMLRYDTPTPECNQVLSVQECKAYAPWARNYQFTQYHLKLRPIQIATYPFVWIYHSMGELVFTISSNFNDSGTVDYHAGNQLILIEIVSWGVFGIGGLLVLLNIKRLWRREELRIFIVVILLYVAALGAQNMQDYIHIGLPFGIHGRYLLPVLPLIYIIIALAFRETFDHLHVKRAQLLAYKSGLAAVMMFLLLFEGGGFVTYIVRSDPSWFWPQSSPVQKVNSGAKKILKPLVVDTKKK